MWFWVSNSKSSCVFGHIRVYVCSVYMLDTYVYVDDGLIFRGLLSGPTMYLYAGPYGLYQMVFGVSYRVVRKRWRTIRCLRYAQNDIASYVGIDMKRHGYFYCLVNVAIAPPGRDVSVYRVIASNSLQGSCMNTSGALLGSSLDI